MIIKEIEGLKDYYATTTGKIYSNRTGIMVELKGYDNDGYRQVELYGKCYKAHRLIAMTFIPNPLNLPQVNHIDGDKTNNEVDNLEWCDNSYNQVHAWNNGLQPHRAIRNVKNRSLTDEDVAKIREEYERIGTTHKKLAEKYGVSKTTIGDALRGRYYGSNVEYKSARKQNNRVFTIEQADSIREEHKLTGSSYRKLAEKYNVNPTTISDIIRNKSYVKQKCND